MLSQKEARTIENRQPWQLCQTPEPLDNLFPYILNLHEFYSEKSPRISSPNSIGSSARHFFIKEFTLVTHNNIHYYTTFYSFLSRSSAQEFIQKRTPVLSFGPSSNLCPKCAPQFAQTISGRLIG